jgi:hypothetical protein
MIRSIGAIDELKDVLRKTAGGSLARQGSHGRLERTAISRDIQTPTKGRCAR